MLLVSDDEVRAAVGFLALRARVVVEPTGAVAAAAVLAGRLPPGAGAAWSSPAATSIRDA